MNEEILNEWIELGKIIVPKDSYNSLLFFVKYFDKSSLRLHQVENNIYTFTNDAQYISLSLAEILKHSQNLKQGIIFPWNKYEE
jgi:hypothetical protein